MDLPFVPSYVARHGGWVLDRVLHTLGSRGTGWWTTITARLRAQQALQQHVAGSRYVLLDPRNYALSCRAKSNAGPLGTLQGTVEFESLQQLSRLVDGEEDDLPPPPQVRSTLRRGLLGGHELRGEVALHGHYQTNSGEELEIPRVISLDVASDKRKGGIRYQAGAYHTVSKLGTDAPEDLEAGAGPELERRDFFQAALSVEQEFSLWKQPRAEATGGGGGGGARGGGPPYLKGTVRKRFTRFPRHRPSTPSAPTIERPTLSGAPEARFSCISSFTRSRGARSVRVSPPAPPPPARARSQRGPEPGHGRGRC